jgi:hypothetical protein
VCVCVYIYIYIYIFLWCVIYESQMKSSSNTAPRHIKTCVQFYGALVQQSQRKTKIWPVCMCFLHTEIPLTQWKCRIEGISFKKQYFYQRKLHVIWNYSLAIFWFFSHTFIRISIVTTHKFQKPLVSLVKLMF